MQSYIGKFYKAFSRQSYWCSQTKDIFALEKNSFPNRETFHYLGNINTAVVISREHPLWRLKIFDSEITLSVKQKFGMSNKEKFS